MTSKNSFFRRDDQNVPLQTFFEGKLCTASKRTCTYILYTYYCNLLYIYLYNYICYINRINLYISIYIFLYIQVRTEYIDSRCIHHFWDAESWRILRDSPASARQELAILSRRVAAQLEAATCGVWMPRCSEARRKPRGPSWEL